MKYTHSEHELSAIAKSLTQKDDQHFLVYVEVLAVLGKFWPERFTSTEYLVLSFIIHRTLIFRKRAETISRKHFMQGISNGRGVTCSGVGVSETALKVALKRLCDDDYIHIHAFQAGHIESTPRIYELNHEAILAGYDTGEVQNMLKRSRKETREAPENGDFYAEDTPPKSRGGGGRILGGITELLHSSNTSSLKEEESATDAPRKGAALRTSRKAPKEGEINCTTDAPIAGDARERIAQMQKASTQARSVRLSAVRELPARRWDIKDLQTLLDEARVRSGVSVPRIMATAKGAGVLFKRMKDSEIKDPLDFFTWTLKNWVTVANANRRAKAKQMKDTKAVNSEMSMIPNFAEIAYRFPYILVFYNDRHYTEVQQAEAKQVRETTTAKTVEGHNAAIERRRNATREQDLRRREEDQQAEADFVARKRTKPAAVEIDDDEPVAQFREREWKR